MKTTTIIVETENNHALRMIEELAELKLVRIRHNGKASKEYEQVHEPLSVEEFVESIKLAESEIDNGDCDSLDDFENTSKQWD